MRDVEPISALAGDVDLSMSSYCWTYTCYAFLISEPQTRTVDRDMVQRIQYQYISRPDSEHIKMQTVHAGSCRV